jgi:hypothetical protein
MVKALQSAGSTNVFQYQTAKGGWLPSTLYLWDDMIDGVKIVAGTGIGKQKLYVGEGHDFTYGLVSPAAFLGESMTETIVYSACDENNWSNPAATQEFGGSPCTASYSCGQGKQSYQDYKCSKADNELAGGKMACGIGLAMAMRAHTCLGPRPGG